MPSYKDIFANEPVQSIEIIVSILVSISSILSFIFVFRRKHHAPLCGTPFSSHVIMYLSWLSLFLCCILTPYRSCLSNLVFGSMIPCLLFLGLHLRCWNLLYSHRVKHIVRPHDSLNQVEMSSMLAFDPLSGTQLIRESISAVRETNDTLNTIVNYKNRLKFLWRIQIIAITCVVYMLLFWIGFFITISDLQSTSDVLDTTSGCQSDASTAFLMVFIVASVIIHGGIVVYMVMALKYEGARDDFGVLKGVKATIWIAVICSLLLISTTPFILLKMLPSSSLFIGVLLLFSTDYIINGMCPLLMSYCWQSSNRPMGKHMMKKKISLERLLHDEAGKKLFAAFAENLPAELFELQTEIKFYTNQENKPRIYKTSCANHIYHDILLIHEEKFESMGMNTTLFPTIGSKLSRQIDPSEELAIIYSFVIDKMLDVFLRFYCTEAYIGWRQEKREQRRRARAIRDGAGDLV